MKWAGQPPPQRHVPGEEPPGYKALPRATWHLVCYAHRTSRFSPHMEARIVLNFRTLQRALLGVVVAAAVIPFSTDASTLYVAPGGAGDGTSGNPFGRIADALAVAVAGDTVLLKPGVYSERVRTVRGGTSSSRLVIRAETRRQGHPGERGRKRGARLASLRHDPRPGRGRAVRAVRRRARRQRGDRARPAVPRGETQLQGLHRHPRAGQRGGRTVAHPPLPERDERPHGCARHRGRRGAQSGGARHQDPYVLRRRHPTGPRPDRAGLGPSSPSTAASSGWSRCSRPKTAFRWAPCLARTRSTPRRWPPRRAPRSSCARPRRGAFAAG